MKRIFKSALSFLLVAVMVLGAAPLSGFVGLELPKIGGINLPEFGGFEKMKNAVSDFFEDLIIWAKAESYGDFTYYVSNGEAIIKKCDTNAEGKIVVPDTIEGYPVTRIQNYAFSNCPYIQEVVIGNNVTTINAYAFHNCSSLRIIRFGKKLVNFELSLFENCDRLVSFIVDEANPNFSSDENGVMYNKDKTELICFPKKRNECKIPTSVKRIGFGAFANSNILVSIDIPKGVTSIGAAAFMLCANLKSVTIPDTVETLESLDGVMGQFIACPNLISIKVDSKNPCFSSDDSGALYNKDKTVLIAIPGVVDSYNVPDTVVTLAPYFSATGWLFNSANDSRLKNIILPNSLTEIQEYAFANLNLLEKITIPSSVTKIASNAFEECNNLKSVTISNSITDASLSAFSNCSGLTDIYFSGSKTEWNNYPSKSNGVLKNATIHFFNNSHIENQNGNYVLKFVDKDYGTVIKKKTIKINNKEFEIKSGTLSIKASDLKADNIITASGYANYYFELSHLDNQEETITLSKIKSTKKPYISSVYCRNISVNSAWKNVSSETVSVDISSDDFYNIRVYADKLSGGADIKTICLAQDSKHLLKSSDGVFSGKKIAEIFDEDKDIYAYCIDNKGTKSNVFPVNISIKNAENTFSKWLDGYDLFSYGGHTVTLSKDIPIIGGTTCGVDLTQLPVSVSKDGSIYRIALGIEKDTFTKEGWNGLKKSIDSLDDPKLNNLQKYDKMKKTLKENGGRTTHGKLVSDPSLDWCIMGYAEFDIVDGKPVALGGYIAISVSAGWSFQTPYIVLGVPCYSELELEVEAVGTGSLQRINADPDTPIEWRLTLTINPSVSLGVGVGVPKFLSVGISGKGEFDFYFEFLNKYKRIDLTLSASIKARLFVFKFKKKIASKTWNLVNGVYKKSANISNVSMENAYAPMYYDLNYYTEVDDRAYLENMQWIGGISPYSRRRINVGGYETSTLMTSIYDDSRHQLINLDNGNKMLIFIMDDVTRTSENRTKLVYSIYDAQTGIWSEPSPVSSNETADFYPNAVYDGENVWVAWQSLNTEISEEDALAENYASSSEICVAKYNSTTGTFEETKSITSNDTLDSLPQIVSENGAIKVVWVNNDANDALGFTGANSIMTSELKNGVWSEATQLKTDLTAINSIDATLNNGKLYVAYAYDDDNDYNDMSDMEIYKLVSDGNNITETKVTNNDVLDSAPQFGVLNGETKLFWYSEKNIFVSEINGENAPTTVFDSPTDVNDSFVIADTNINSNYIIWPQNKGQHIAFYSAVYNGTKWSEPVLVGESGGKALNPSATVNDDGTMFIVFNNIHQNLITVPAEDGADDFTYYEDGQTDLCVLKVLQNANISVDGSRVSIECEDAFPGKEIPMDITVTNNSIVAVDGVDVYINDTLASKVSVNLNPGESKDITVDYTMPETISKQEVVIKALPASTTDYDLSDNEVSVEYGFTDISVENVEVSDSPLRKTLSATIKNISAVESGLFIVRVHEDSEDGNVVYEESIENLNVGETLFTTCVVDKSKIEYSDDGVKRYYVEVVSDSEEYLKSNNVGSISFIEEKSEGIDAAILTENIVAGQLELSAAIKNNEFNPKEIYIKIEAVDGEGKVVGSVLEKVILDAKELYDYSRILPLSGSDNVKATITVIEDIVYVNNVSVNPEAITVCLNEVMQLSAKVEPANATNPHIIWSSSDENIVVVDKNGLLNPVSEGTATITATSVEGICSAQCEVTVLPGLYTVKWNVNGKEKTDTIRAGDKITTPEKPILDGYEFAGWTPEIPDVMPSENLEFTAVFEPIEYYAEFVADGVTVSRVPYTVETDSVDVPEVPSKTGYSGKWEDYKLSVGGITVNAIYTVNAYKVTWVVDGEETQMSVNYGESIDKSFVPQKDGYKFMGWTPDVPQTMPASDLTFTAVFEKSYICPDCGEEILGEGEINAHITAEARMKATVKIRNNNGSKTIKYGETLRLTAITTNMPADARIYWYVDDIVQGEGETFNVRFESGTKTVEVKIVDSNGIVLRDANGNEIKDSETVTVKGGFLQKIISFFKNLFGMNRTIVQAIFKNTF